MNVDRLIAAQEASYPISLLCRDLHVARSGFSAWRSRPPSCRSVADATLTSTIRAMHSGSRGTYGVPRVHAELSDTHGVQCGRMRVARLMRRAGLAGVCRRRSVRTTRGDVAAAPAPDLVKRTSAAHELDRLWMADITYLPTGRGFLYLSVVVDACSRKVVGWAMADHPRAELVVAALDMALWNRRASLRSRGPVHQSGVRSSVSCSPGRPLDGIDRQLFRQRPCRELLRHTGVRTDRAHPLAHPHGSPRGNLRLYRVLLQPASTSFSARLPQPNSVRSEETIVHMSVASYRPVHGTWVTPKAPSVVTGAMSIWRWRQNSNSMQSRSRPSSPARNTRRRPPFVTQCRID